MANTFKSEFSKKVYVNVVNVDDFEYELLEPLFNEYGYGFVSPEDNVIFIDGQYDSLYQKIVEAHEVSHILLGHDENEGEDDEVEADLLAISILNKFGYSREAKFLGRKFKGRHGLSLNDISLKFLKDKVDIYSKKIKVKK